MTVVQAITVAYLAVSALSLLVQARHLHRMRRAKASHGLTRTAACRVGCSVLYVLVGVNAIAVHWVVLQSTFAVYATTAVTWWINSLLDDNLTSPPSKEDSMTTRRIPETVVAGRRLGRHVEHDPRSLAYLVPEAATVSTVVWRRVVPVFDQGQVGSCTGNAAAGVLGTVPFDATLPAGLVDDESEALKLYSAAEVIDGNGTYPPNDQGSSGLSVAKAAKNAGLISGYQHITSVAAAHTAIQSGPFIVGSDWHDGMDNPDANGVVLATGSVRGGHEYECVGYHADTDLWEFVNSWGPSFGVAGRFFYSSATFAQLLAAQGDATVFVPVSQPAPTPTPTPVPAATVTYQFDAAGAADLEAWAAYPHVWSKATRAAKAWKRGTAQ